MAQTPSNRLTKKTRSVESHPKTERHNEAGASVSGRKVIAQSIEYSSGPLPHPSILESYNNIIPDGAERIMAMAERQLNHRIETESFVARKPCRNAKEARTMRLSYLFSLFRLPGFLV